MRGLGNFAVKVAPAQGLGLVVQRKFAGIIGEDPARVDNYALRLGSLPMLPPPLDVVVSRIDFGDVRLAPTISTAIPGRLWALLPGPSPAEAPRTG